MEPIAVYSDSLIIYWRPIVILLGTIVSLLLCFAMYGNNRDSKNVMLIFSPLAVILALLFGKMLHWYCNMEQYEGLGDALTHFSKGDLLIPGVLFGVWLAAVIVAKLMGHRSRMELLDAVAPGLALLIAFVRIADVFTDSCRGKMTVEWALFQRLPFAIAETDGNGEVTYRLASFMLSFIIMLVITAVLVIFFVNEKNWTKKRPMKKYGHTFRLFLMLYGAMEIVIDSTRYDAAHLAFPGEALAALNKGAMFMGLAQLLGAICMVYGLVYYAVMTTKVTKNFRKALVPIIVFVVGIVVGGVSEYLVQRYSSMHVLWYTTQILGVVAMFLAIAKLYTKCVKFTSSNEKK